MLTIKKIEKFATAAALAAVISFCGSGAYGAQLVLSDSPLFLSANVPPMNLLVMGRDHKLYYEAYNDHSDLDGDGVLDTRYKGYELKNPVPAAPDSPYKIDYYGYFDSFKCYTHDGTQFNPVAETLVEGGIRTKKCSGQWSGDYLNYLTTSRIDALRKVLYGGYRSTDTSTDTVLQRAHIPQDAHSWGKEYSASDGYNISDYTPYSMPASGTRHLFANTTPRTANGLNELPKLRVLLNRSDRIWNWVSKERPVADAGYATLDADLTVRVRVCVYGGTLPMEDNCLTYPSGNAKPTGLLQEFGENDTMLFGLLSGSYSKNTSGGVLRRAMGSIQDEIELNDGRFKTAYNGIITTLNRLHTTGFNTSHEYTCGWTSASRVINEGECQMWGNPIAEMMYEGVRYFAGKSAATPSFAVAFGAGEEADLPGGGLPVATWNDPYASPRPACTKPFQTVISDINPSYDSDQLPGTYFGSFSGDVSGLDVSTIGQTIWDREIGGSGTYFIGQSGALSDDAPTAKTVTSFGNIRGMAPEEPTKQGSYYSASVAHFARTNDISNATGTQNMNTFAVALASPLPKIEIPVGTRKITLVPFAKSVGGCLGADGAFKATNQIVDFYVDSLTATSGRFRVNFEDVEQGADHDMDAIVIYEYEVSGNTVTVRLTSEYAAGCIIQHIGYVISGTESDGIYLEVRDRDTAEDTDPDYALDTPNTTDALPFTASRTFIAGTTSGAEILKDPLWYAAKWGGFSEGASGNGIPDSAAEWDADGDTVPDNYFLVTNALKLNEQLSNAFADIVSRVASASSASVNSGSINSGSKLYQAKFNSGNWTGQLLAYNINANGSLASAASWDAATRIPTPDNRRIITVNTNGSSANTYVNGVPFRFTASASTGIDTLRKRQLDNATSSPWNATLQERRLNYLRGDATHEAVNGGIFRTRETKLGDIISSSPVFVGRPSLTYSDTVAPAPYSTFKATYANRTPVVYVGANDGMLHAFNANTGDELLGFIPGAVFKNLKTLTNRGYNHKFYVDGSPTVADAYFDGGWKTVLVGGLNAGGQTIYALNITNPANFSEANADYDASANPNGIFMWEYADADLGYTYSQPLVVRARNSNSARRWVAIFGNGYNNRENDGSRSSTGYAYLYVVDLATGALIRKISTNTGSTTTPNGLATPVAADLDGDGIAESVYAGDLLGNLWKFDLNNDDPAQWRVAYTSSGNPAPLFVARDAGGNRQPITSQPRIIRGPGSVGAIVLFGTGQFLEPNDKSSTAAQTLYGIYDNNSGANSDIVVRSELLQQTILSEFTATFGSTSREVRVTSDNAVTTTTRGWYLDLLDAPNPPGTARGERMISTPRVRNGRVIFVTIVPGGTDPCAQGGKTRLTELDAVSGSRLDDAPLDLNGDGLINDDDNVEIVLPDNTRVDVPVSSVTLGVNYGTAPGVISGGDAEYYYISGDDNGGPNPLGADDIQAERGAPGDNARGRQSWRQLR